LLAAGVEPAGVADRRLVRRGRGIPGQLRAVRTISARPRDEQVVHATWRSPVHPTTTLLRSRAVKKLLVLLVVAGIAFIAAKKFRATS
jgi:hypothetical protein